MVKPILKQIHDLVPKPSTTDIPALDGLRGVAMLLVLMVHSMFELNEHSVDPGIKRFLHSISPIYGIGGTGVHLFFVLSGFLLFLPYASAILGDREFPDTRKFYIRRMLRILPAYWIAMILMIGLLHRELLSGPGLKIILAHVFLVQNVLPGARDAINGVFWTMSVEAQFYLVLPIIAWFLYRTAKSGKPGLTTFLFLVLLAGSSLHTVVGILVKHRLPMIYGYWEITKLLGFLSTFATGMVISLFYTAILQKRLEIPPNTIRNLAKAAGAVGVFLIVLHQFLLYRGRDLSRLDYVFFSLYMGVAYSGILLGTLLGWPSWRRLQSTWGMRFLGMISYSVYIWHYRIYQNIIIPLALKCASGPGTFVLIVALTFILVFPIGLVSFLITEKPFFSKRRTLRQG